MQGRGSKAPVAVRRTLPSPHSPVMPGPWHPSSCRCRRKKQERSVVVALRETAVFPLTSPTAPQHRQSLAPGLPRPKSTLCSAPKPPLQGMQQHQWSHSPPQTHYTSPAGDRAGSRTHLAV